MSGCCASERSNLERRAMVIAALFLRSAVQVVGEA